MDPKWNEDQPIYRQLRDRVVAMILEGVLGDGDALPSVRNVAAEYRLNPLTVLKGYQELVDEGLVEKKAWPRHVRQRRRAYPVAQGRTQAIPRTRNGQRSGRRSSGSGSTPRNCWQPNRTGMRETIMSSLVTARNVVSKHFGDVRAVDNVSFDIEKGKNPGPDRPQRRRQDDAAQGCARPHRLRRRSVGSRPRPVPAAQEAHAQICFIADVAVLPRLDQGHAQLLDYVEAVHPEFLARSRAEELLSSTKVASGAKVKELSKGMVHAAAPRDHHVDRRQAAGAR